MIFRNIFILCLIVFSSSKSHDYKILYSEYIFKSDKDLIIIGKSEYRIKFTASVKDFEIKKMISDLISDQDIKKIFRNNRMQILFSFDFSEQRNIKIQAKVQNIKNKYLNKELSSLTSFENGLSSLNWNFLKSDNLQGKHSCVMFVQLY